MTTDRHRRYVADGMLAGFILGVTIGTATNDLLIGTIVGILGGSIVAFFRRKRISGSHSESMKQQASPGE